jgi:hypothetical protein
MERAPLIRQLNPADRDAFFQLRLRALLAHPESFSQSHQEALEKGPEQYDVRQQGAQAAEGDFLLGAFAAADQSLIGMVGLALLTELLARAERVAGLRHAISMNPPAFVAMDGKSKGYASTECSMMRT